MLPVLCKHLTKQFFPLTIVDSFSVFHCNRIFPLCTLHQKLYLCSCKCEYGIWKAGGRVNPWRTQTHLYTHTHTHTV